MRTAHLFSLSLTLVIWLTFVAVGSKSDQVPLTWTLHTGVNLYDVAYGDGKFVAVGESGVVFLSRNTKSWDAYNLSVAKTITSVAYGNGQFVAVGRKSENVIGWKGLMLTSQDGKEWQRLDIPMIGEWIFDYKLTDVTFGNGYFVAVGERGAFVRYDGNKMEPGVMPISGKNLSAVTYGDGVYVAVGEDGTIAISYDGTDWYTQDSNTIEDLVDVAFGNGVFIAIGDQTALISEDAIQWEELGELTGLIKKAGLSRTTISFANGKFFALGGVRLVSQDGRSWTPMNLPKYYGLNKYGLNKVTYGGNTFLAVADGGGILTSSDGFSWTERNPPYKEYGVILYGAGKYILLDSFIEGFDNGDLTKFKQRVVVSDDGRAWKSAWITVYIKDRQYGVISSMVYGNNTFVAISEPFDITTAPGPSRPAIFYSKDFETWYSADLQFDANVVINSIAYGNDRFLVLILDGKDNTIYKSDDGQTWEQITTFPITEGPDRLVFAGDKFFGISYANRGYIYVSSDGVSWTKYRLPVKSSLSGVAYGNSTYVAVGMNCTILISKDTRRWIPQKPPRGCRRVEYVTMHNLPSNFRGISFGKGVFVAVTSDEKVYVSPNGKEWEILLPARHWDTAGFDFQSVYYANDLFVLISPVLTLR